LADLYLPPDIRIRDVADFAEIVEGLDVVLGAGDELAVSIPFRIAVIIDRKEEAAVAQQLEQDILDRVLVGIRQLFDFAAEVVQETGAEVADDAGGLPKLVADDRQRKTEDIAIHQILHAAECSVDAVDDKQHLIEQAYMAEAFSQACQHVRDVED